MSGLNLMDKTLAVRGARLAFNIWDVAGDSQSVDHVPIACKDAVAILFMFDLTSRCTLTKLVHIQISSPALQAQTTNSEFIHLFVTTRCLFLLLISLLQYYRLVREGKEVE
jgi:hypothetical protein